MSSSRITTNLAIRHLLLSLRKPGILALILATISLLLGSILLIRQQKLDKEVEALKHDNQELKIVVGDFKETVSTFYGEYQETGSLTAEAIIATFNRLEAAIEVYDENVDLYNSQIPELYDRTDKLQRQINILVDYISN